MRRVLLAALLLVATLRVAPALTPTPVYQIHFDGWHARLDAAALAVISPIAADPAANRVAIWVCYADAAICQDVRRDAS